MPCYATIHLFMFGLLHFCDIASGPPPFDRNGEATAATTKAAAVPVEVAVAVAVAIAKEIAVAVAVAIK